jgi:hypothetical protein
MGVNRSWLRRLGRLLCGHRGARRHAADDIFVEQVARRPPFFERQRFEVAPFGVQLPLEGADDLVRTREWLPGANEVMRHVGGQQQA